MALQRMWDDDPDKGAGRYMVYEVISLDALMNPDAEGWRQRQHPTDSQRQAGSDGGTAASVRQSRKKYRDPTRKLCACKNYATEGRDTCSSCRAIAKQIVERPTCLRIMCNRVVMQAGAYCWVCRSRGVKRAGYLESRR